MTTTENRNQIMNIARAAALSYLALAITGVVGFIVYHPQVFNADPSITLSNIIDNESTARIRVLLEFAILISQALTAVYFYKLFKSINEWAAWTLGIWGTVNTIAIMVSAIAMGSTLGIVNSDQSLENKVLMIELLNSLITNAWGVGSLFFGLWLIPMGYIVISSQRLPIWLGRILIIGGVGYLLSAFIGYMGIKHTLLDLLTVPATIGEFWMIGYLLIYGIRPAEEGIPG